MPRVILYKGSFAYDGVNAFVDDLAAGLAALGRETVLIDLTVEAERSRIEAELALPFEFIVAFGAIGNRPQTIAPGLHMYDRLTAPYVAVLVDHPAWHLDRFSIGNMILTCHDRTHVAFLGRYFGGTKRVAFLPHGGSAASDGAGGGGARPIGILFPGTYTDPNAGYATLRQALAPDVFDIMDFVVERLLVNDSEPMEEALSTVLAGEGRQSEWQRLSGYLPMVESFVKPYKRLTVLKHLDEAGLPIEIAGDHWPDALFRHHRIRPALSYREVLHLMQKSKMVLNMGFVPDGSHERVFSALLSGALPVSDGNPYLEESFPDKGDALLFRWSGRERLAEGLGALLERRDALAEYPARAAQLGEAHTWASRAAALIALVRDAATA